MVPATASRTIRSSWKEIALAAILVTAATWAGVRWSEASAPRPPRDVHAVHLESRSGPCDQSGMTNVALRIETSDEAGLVVPPAEFVLRWSDLTTPTALSCVETDDERIDVATTAMASTGRGAGIRFAVEGLTRGREVSIDVGLPWPSDATVQKLRTNLEPLGEPTTATDARSVTVAVRHLDPPLVRASLVGPTGGAPLQTAAAVELRLDVENGTAENVAARIPLAAGLTVGGLFADSDGDCAPAPDAITCRWPSITGTATAVLEILLAPTEPTCTLLVLCLEAQVTWSSSESGSEVTAHTEIELVAPIGFSLSSFDADGERVYTVSSTSTVAVSNVRVDDPECQPVTPDGPTHVDPGATLIFRCVETSTATREVTVTGSTSNGRPVTGSVEVSSS